MKKMIEVYGADSFVPQIRQIFLEGTEQERIQKCISWEHRVLERILGHPRWINRFIGSEVYQKFVLIKFVFYVFIYQSNNITKNIYFDILSF